MSEREHQRVPYTAQIEFRTASSFLVAYSVNLSRGGIFVETEQDVPSGAMIELQFTVPGVGAFDVTGVVAWRRGPDHPEGPAGFGIEFQDIAPQLGGVIDRLVSGFTGVSVLLLSGDRQDRTTLARLIKSIISTAEIVQAADARVAETLLTSDIDLAIIDVDFDADGGIAALRAARALTPRVPTVALASSKKLRDLAKAAGADEVSANPPPFGDFQIMLVRALGKPVNVR
jgi:uncharacterized protein (TIGR02266 family)